MSVWKSDEKLLIFASLISPSIKIIRTVPYRYVYRSLQCRRILGGRNLVPVAVRNIVVAAIFDFMTLEDWGKYKSFLSSGSFNVALSRANCAPKENACTAGYVNRGVCFPGKN